MNCKKLMMAAGLVMLCLVSCKKEASGDRFMVYTESYDGEKILFNTSDRTSTWNTGDQVRLNSTEGTVTVSSGVAELMTEQSTTSPYYALYPASIVPENTTTVTGTMTVNLPSEYNYEKTTDGKQIIAVPMAAYSESSNSLTFKHLTGALVVNIKNDNTSNTFNIEELTIVSDRYCISGTHSVTLGGTPSVHPVLATSATPDAHKRVSISCRGINLNRNQSVVDVVVPVAPVGDDNKFTVIVKFKKNSSGLYTYSREQGAAASLGRNEAASVPVKLDNSTTYTTSGLPGSGTSTDPYQITSIADFNYFISTNNQTGHYKLMNDIAYTGSTPLYSTPSSSAFKGTFDGDNHKISGLVVGGTKNFSVFQNLTGASASSPCVIKNVELENVRFVQTGTGTNTLSIGGITTQATNAYVNISNVSISWDASGVQTYSGDSFTIGGIAAKSKKIIVNNCSVTIGSLSLSHTKTNASNDQLSYFGGIVGNVLSGAPVLSDNEVAISTINFDIPSDVNHGVLIVGGLVGSYGGGNVEWLNNEVNWGGNGLTTNVLTGDGNVGKLYLGGAVGQESNGIAWNGLNISGKITYNVTSNVMKFVGKILGKGTLGTTSDVDMSGLHFFESTTETTSSIPNTNN